MASKSKISWVTVVCIVLLLVVFVSDLRLSDMMEILNPRGLSSTAPGALARASVAPAAPVQPGSATDTYIVKLGTPRTAFEAFVDGTIVNSSPVRLRHCFPKPHARALFKTDDVQLAEIKRVIGTASNLTGGAPRSCVVGPYDRDFEHIAARLRDVDGPGLAFVRFADGELGVLKGQRIGNAEWYFTKEGEPSLLRDDLTAALRGHFGEEFYYGFPSPADDANGLRWFLEHTEQGCGYISYANIWVNSHFNKTLTLLDELTTKLYYKKVVLVVNAESVQKVKETKDWAADYFPLADDIPPKWENSTFRDEIIQNVQNLARKYDGHLFIVSGGPPGKVLSTKMWEANCRNKYVDFGSSVDPYLRNKHTRGYQDPTTHYARQVDPMWHFPAHNPDAVPAQYG